MSLIIWTIQLLEHPPFPGKKIKYCIPSIETPTFEIIIPISEHLHIAELNQGSTNVYKTYTAFAELQRSLPNIY